MEGLTHDPGNVEGMGCDFYSAKYQYFESDKDLLRDHAFWGRPVGDPIVPQDCCHGAVEESKYVLSHCQSQEIIQAFKINL